MQFKYEYELGYEQVLRMRNVIERTDVSKFNVICQAAKIQTSLRCRIKVNNVFCMCGNHTKFIVTVYMQLFARIIPSMWPSNRNCRSDKL